jgi:cystathionine beta-lyase
MMSKRYDFDTVINRKNTGSAKHDMPVRITKSESILPLTVGDMDFPVADEVLDYIHRRVEHGIFGYTDSSDEYFQAIYDWMDTRHRWQIQEEWMVKVPGVVFALAMAVQAYTQPGDGVIIQDPVYHLFEKIIKCNDREVINNPLVLKPGGRYYMDLVDFEEKVKKHNVKLFLLCSPHNPVSRVWSKKELEELGKICQREKVIVISDEIHQDFAFHGHTHYVFSDLSEELNQQTVTCTAPSKSFNLAGLQVSNIFIANPELRRKFNEKVLITGYETLNTLGIVACEGAYREGGEWFDQLLEYIYGNVTFIREFLEARIPEVKLMPSDGTYMAWLDVRALNLTLEEQKDLIIKKADIWLDPGTKFGDSGLGFWRMNISCSRLYLEEALCRLEKAVKSLDKKP